MNYDLHFRDRLKQRFGLGKDVIREILSKVTPNNFIRRSINGNSIYQVHWTDKLMYVVVSGNHGGAVTVMTHKMYVLKEIEHGRPNNRTDSKAYQKSQTTNNRYGHREQSEA